MSFIITNGIIYHCKNCQAEKKINFDRAPLMLQIGDMAVIEQSLICQQYKFDSSYMHKINCICSKCCNNLYDQEQIKITANFIGQCQEIRNSFKKEKERTEKLIDKIYGKKLSDVLVKFNIIDFDKNIITLLKHEKNLQTEKGQNKIIKRYYN